MYVHVGGDEVWAVRRAPDQAHRDMPGTVRCKGGAGDAIGSAGGVGEPGERRQGAAAAGGARGSPEAGVGIGAVGSLDESQPDENSAPCTSIALHI